MIIVTTIVPWLGLKEGLISQGGMAFRGSPLDSHDLASFFHSCSSPAVPLESHHLCIWPIEALVVLDFELIFFPSKKTWRSNMVIFPHPPWMAYSTHMMWLKFMVNIPYMEHLGMIGPGPLQNIAFIYNTYCNDWSTTRHRNNKPPLTRPQFLGKRHARGGGSLSSHLYCNLMVVFYL